MTVHGLEWMILEPILPQGERASGTGGYGRSLGRSATFGWPAGQQAIQRLQVSGFFFVPCGSPQADLR